MAKTTLFNKGRKRKAKNAGPLKAAQRSLQRLRDAGYLGEVVERYVSRVAGRGQAAKFSGGFRKDYCGFADLLLFHPSMPGVLAVQCTSRQQVAAHLRSYRENAEVRNALLVWLAQPGRHFQIHGWEAVEKPCRNGGTLTRWECTVRTIGSEDL